MKKKNVKGFILVETLVVTVFVVTLFVFIYRITIPSIGEYEQLNVYDDIDSIYYSNLYKQMVTRYANITYIDNYLNDHTYIDIGDCSNKDLFINGEYCSLLKEKLGVTSEDKVFLTKYNIKDFKQEVKTNEIFDSGTLSNFRDYIKTVPNHEVFYNNLKESDLIGKYRLFLVRTIENSDETKSRRYVNIGIYTGDYLKLLAGDKVVYDPGDGEKTFYVLHNSSSTDSQITLILAENLENSYSCFNTNKKDDTAPDIVLNKLKALTKNWTNVPYLTGYKYATNNNYTINYNGYRARLLEPSDIMDILGCREDDKTCFDEDNAFEVEFDIEKIPYLSPNLTGDYGYWTSKLVPNSYWTDPNVPDVDQYSYSLAWAIKQGKVSPVGTNDCEHIGIRPVITVDKADVREVNE